MTGDDRAAVTVGVEADDAGRLPRQRADRLREGEDARLDERGQHDGQRGLDPEHARRRLLERHVLALGRVARGRSRSRRSSRRAARRAARRRRPAPAAAGSS